MNQFARGASLITTQEEREQVAELSLTAGKRAKAATAYDAALQYFSAGRALVRESGWEQCYQLTFDLELNWAECEYLTGELASAEERLTALSKRARTTVDSAAVTCVRLNLYTNLDQSDGAVEVGQDYLRRADSEWPLHVTVAEVRQHYERLFQRLGSGSIEALLDLPQMSDPERCATMDVLTALASPALFTDENIFRLVVCRMATLSLEHGNSDGSCLAYEWLGGILGTHFGDYHAGFRFGRLGLDLVEKRGLDRLRARVYLVFAVHVAPWMQHLPTCRVFLQRSFEAALEAGDLTYAAYSCADLTTNRLASGDPLGEVEREAGNAQQFVQKVRFGLISDLITTQLRLTRQLRGLTPDFNSFSDAEFDEVGFEQRLESNPALHVAASRYWIRKLQGCVHAGDSASAVAAALKAEPLLWNVPTQVELSEYHFYAALARSARCDMCLGRRAASPFRRTRGASRTDRGVGRAIARKPSPIARPWSAPRSRVWKGGSSTPSVSTKKPSGSAREHGFIQNEGMANELAARFYAARGFDTIADAYLRNARSCYLRWGADGKVRQLDQVHPQLRQEPASPRSDGTSGTRLEHLDLATVVKVSQAVSSEIDLKKLIDTLMVTALEHAGAERGLLILPHRDEMRIEAEATTVRDTVDVRIRQARVAAAELPESVLRYVVRTRDSLLLDDASDENPFSGDEYIRDNHCRSILCLPLTKQTNLIGVLYLENNQTSHVFTPARIAVLRLLASQAAISLENAHLYSDLKHTEAYLAEAQRLSHTGSFVLRVASGELIWSEETFRIYGLDPATKPTYERALQQSHPEDADIVRHYYDHPPFDGKDHDFEQRIITPDGSEKNIHVVFHVERDSSGDIEYFGTVVDITASKHAQERLQASLEEKEALLKEVHHRVKNNLQLISSLLNLQAAGIADPAVAEHFVDSRNRVRAMALVHENLYRAGNFARVPMRAHIQNLSAHLIRAYGLNSRHVELATEIDDVELDLDRAISTGLIISELVSNALKHAFPDGRAGRVRIVLKTSGRQAVCSGGDRRWRRASSRYQYGPRGIFGSSARSRFGAPAPQHNRCEAR